VRAAGTSLTGLLGAGPVITAAVLGDVRHASRFPSRNHFAACNGTAPVEVSSGGRKIYRLSRRGNRRLNHAIHMAAVTQIRNPGSEGRTCFEKKLAAETPDQRRYLRLSPGRRPARRRPSEGPGRATGEPLCLQGGWLTPRAPALRTSHSRARPPPYDPSPYPRRGWPFPDRCPIAAGGPQVQVERPQRREDERPEGAARRQPYPATRKARGTTPSYAAPQRPKATPRTTKKTDRTS
jgi:hypothetical protein